MYAYLIGSLMFGLVWLYFVLRRPDLRKPMLWTAIVYILFSWIIVAAWYLLRNYIYLGEPIVPGYWYPLTLFNFGKITGFAGIEDVLFLVFISGIATCIYEYISHKKIKLKKTHRPHVLAFFVAFLAFFLFNYLFPSSLVNAFTFSSFAGAVVLVIQRRDLILHSILGGLAFLAVYTCVFIFFLVLFPDFITSFYNFDNLSGILILQIPIEEYLYAFSFGLMWAPLYEYHYGEENS